MVQTLLEFVSIIKGAICMGQHCSYKIEAAKESKEGVLQGVKPGPWPKLSVLSYDTHQQPTALPSMDRVAKPKLCLWLSTTSVGIWTMRDPIQMTPSAVVLLLILPEINNHTQQPCKQIVWTYIRNYFFKLTDNIKSFILWYYMTMKVSLVIKGQLLILVLQVAYGLKCLQTVCRLPE